MGCCPCERPAVPHCWRMNANLNDCAPIFFRLPSMRKPATQSRTQKENPADGRMRSRSFPCRVLSKQVPNSWACHHRLPIGAAQVRIDFSAGPLYYICALHPLGFVDLPESLRYRVDNRNSGFTLKTARFWASLEFFGRTQFFLKPVSCKPVFFRGAYPPQSSSWRNVLRLFLLFVPRARR